MDAYEAYEGYEDWDTDWEAARPRRTRRTVRRRARRRFWGRFLFFLCLTALAALAAWTAVWGAPGTAGAVGGAPDGWGVNLGDLISLHAGSDPDGAETGAHSPDGAGDPDGAETEEDWALLLVNRWNPLPADFTVVLTALSNGQSVDARIYPALQAMFDAARSDGLYPVVAAGYRTEEKQESLMAEKVASLEAEGLSAPEAKEEAEKWVAVPGTSEHQAGLAVDVNADGVHSSGGEVYDWLAANAFRYGFIQRYPAGKEDLTGTYCEPWHYRYVGKAAAQQLQESGQCLEEYLAIGR